MTIWRLEVHEELPSTSDLCLARAAAGEPEGLAILAHRQTGGRGSRGRSWISPPGNLYLSVLLRPNMALAEAGIWPLLVSLALHDALAPLLANPARLTLKWPNDLLLDGAKLAGILLDITSHPNGHIDALIIGCGVNLAVAPNLPNRPTACLRDTGTPPPAPEIFVPTLLTALDHRRAQPPAAIHAAWLSRAHPIGSQLTIAFAGQEIHGRFAGLSPEGHLLLNTPSGPKTLATGEIILSPS